MSLWVKVTCSFFTHRKTLRLRSSIGDAAYWVPPRLWAYAAEHHPDGVLADYTADELAAAIFYVGDASSMLQALLKAGFLDSDPLRIHDWQEHNGYHQAFALRAKNAARARWQKTGSKESRDQRQGDDRDNREEPSIASGMLQASSSESPAPQSPAGSVFDSIWIELCRVYSRPQTTTRDYLEESLLSEISRRQNVAVELEIILAYRDRLPAGDKRFFPQSLPRLLERWQDTLDRARTYQPLTETRNPLAPKLADVQALCREKWGEDPRCSNWAASFFGFWSEPKRNWQRNGRPIDWKVELSAQVSRWKASPQN